MKVPAEEIRSFRTLREFWSAVQRDLPPHVNKLLSERQFMLGALAMWTLVHKFLEMKDEAATLMWQSLKAEIEAHVKDDKNFVDAAVAAEEKLEAAYEAGESLHVGGREFALGTRAKNMDATDEFERDIVPLILKVAELAKTHGIALFAAFEVAHTDSGTRYAQFMQPGPQGRVTRALIDAMESINSKPGEDATPAHYHAPKTLH